MNKVFRLVWNAALGAWVAASELACRHCKSSRVRSALGALSLLLAAPAFAAELPTGGRVVLGQGAISAPSARELTITQESAKLAVDWQSFDVGADHRVRFQQPDAQAIALNRVIGSDGSRIHGRLEANGRVFLVNPHGVLFGAGAQVDVGGLVASTLDISNDDFAAGHYRFESDGTPAAVINHGWINAADGGAVALLGGQVSNHGVISARQGTVALAAGERVRLDFAGDGLLSVEIDAAARDALVENHQLIQADGGQVVMSAHAADALLQTVVNNTGVIEAGSISNEGGVVRLLAAGGNVASSGGIDVSGVTGGSVELLSDQDVLLLAGTYIDASGDLGGGRVRIGGGFQGGEGLRAARRTYVDANAAMRADAESVGDGGEVIVWADETTIYRGRISARGGAESGAGGFAEVSGKESLAFAGTVDLTAPNGEIGTLLLDPRDIVISDTTPAPNDGELADNEILFDESPGADFEISRAAIEAAGAAVVLQATRDITVAADVNATQDLTLEAGRDIAIGNDVQLATTGALRLFADSAFPGQASDGDGTIVFGNANTSISGDFVHLRTGNAVTLGNVTATGSLHVETTNFGAGSGDIAQSGALTVAGDTVLAGVGDITLGNAANSFGGSVSATGNSVLLTDSGAIQLGAIDANTLSVTAGGAITDTVGEKITVAGETRLLASDGSDFFDIVLDNSNTGVGDIHDLRWYVSAEGRNVWLTNASGLTLDDITTQTDGDLTIRAGGPVDARHSPHIAGDLEVTAQSFSDPTDYFDILLNDLHLGGSLFLSGEDIFVKMGSANPVEVRGVISRVDASPDGTVTSFSDGSFGLSARGATDGSAGTISVDGLFIIDGDGDFIFDNANAHSVSKLHAFAGSALGVANNVVLNTKTALQLDDHFGRFTIDGNLTLVAQGAITQASGITVGGSLNAVAVDSSGSDYHDIQLDAAGNSLNGAIRLTGKDIALANSAATGTTLGAITTQGDLAVFSSAGAISHANQAIIVAERTTLQASDGVGEFFDVALDQSGNDFGGAVSINAGDIWLVAENDLVLDLVAAHTNTDFTLTGAAPGSIQVVANGSITDTATSRITVQGAAQFITASYAHHITLNQGAHDFDATNSGYVVNAYGNDIALSDESSLTLGTLYAAADLAVVAGGGISQSPGTVTVIGNSQLSAQGDITLDHATNAFNGTVSVIGDQVRIRDLDALTLGQVEARGLEATADDGDIVFTSDLSLDTLRVAAHQGGIQAQAVDTGRFILVSGEWTQLGAALPAFQAHDFQLQGGSFVRAAGGDGSAAKPYQLFDVYGLQGMGSAGLLDKHFTLVQSIDAQSAADWNSGAGFAPVGDENNSFRGKLDGRGHVIHNLHIDRPTEDYVGLFGFIETGEVRNVGLEGGSVKGHNYVGSLAGRNLSGTLQQVYSSGPVSGNVHVGGLIGMHQFGLIEQAYATGAINGTRWVGGLLGRNHDGTIRQAYASGAIDANNEVGGLIGESYFGAIEQAYATGTVNGANFVGGLVGLNQRGTIQQAYATGAVDGVNEAGGLVGTNNYGTVQQAFWDKDTTRQATSDGSPNDRGLTTEQMRSAAIFVDDGWDLATDGGSSAAWRIYDGHTAPLLRAFMTPLAISVDDVSVTYNAQAFAVSADYSVDSLQPSFWLPAGAVDPSRVLGEAGNTTAVINAGTYTLNGNFYSSQQGYDLSVSDGTLTINPRVLQVSAHDQRKDQGRADPLLTWDFDAAALASGDSAHSVLSGALARAPGEAPGIYAIGPGSLSTNGNYLLDFTAGVFRIDAADSADDLGRRAAGYQSARVAVTEEPQESTTLTGQSDRLYTLVDGGLRLPEGH